MCRTLKLITECAGSILNVSARSERNDEQHEKKNESIHVTVTGFSA